MLNLCLVALVAGCALAFPGGGRGKGKGGPHELMFKPNLDKFAQILKDKKAAYDAMPICKCEDIQKCKEEKMAEKKAAKDECKASCLAKVEVTSVDLAKLEQCKAAVESEMKAFKGCVKEELPARCQKEGEEVEEVQDCGGKHGKHGKHGKKHGKGKGKGKHGKGKGGKGKGKGPHPFEKMPEDLKELKKCMHECHMEKRKGEKGSHEGHGHGGCKDGCRMANTFTFIDKLEAMAKCQPEGNVVDKAKEHCLCMKNAGLDIDCDKMAEMVQSKIDKWNEMLEKMQKGEEEDDD
jgi:hypothetical protein